MPEKEMTWRQSKGAVVNSVRHYDYSIVISPNMNEQYIVRMSELAFKKMCRVFQEAGYAIRERYKG